MKNLQDTLQLEIDDHAKTEEWEGHDKLSLALAGNYRFKKAEALGSSFLVAEPLSNMQVVTLRAQGMAIRRQTGMYAAFYFQKITAYKAKIMLKEKVPFIVEDGQFFLPFLSLYIYNNDVGVKRPPTNLLLN